MSFDDDNRPGQRPGQGAYTPPTDDDLPFRRNSYDPRASGGRNVGSGGGKSPPVTLIVSAVILLPSCAAAASASCSHARAACVEHSATVG